MPSIFFYFERFFRLCQSVFSYAEPFSALPTIVLSTSRFCQAVFGYAEHFPALAFLFHAERCIRSAKHCSSMLNIFSALPSIFLLCWVFVLLYPAFFGYAEPFSALTSIFLLCRAVPSRAEKPLSIDEKCLEEPKSAHHNRKMLGRAGKCSAEKKGSSTEQQCAYKRRIVLVGHNSTPRS